MWRRKCLLTKKVFLRTKYVLLMLVVLQVDLMIIYQNSARVPMVFGPGNKDNCLNTFEESNIGLLD